MFIGTSYPKLDDKFRLILPAKFRDRLVGGVILTKGQENCVVVITRAEYERRAEALTKDVVVGTQEYRRLTRHYFGDADEQTLDSQGRILIAQGLREWAGLGKDLVVAGAGKHIEIWNPQKRAEFMAATSEEFANYSEGEVGQI
ncbi:MAG: transcriptional regulator MraZ [Micrococcales bacterium]|nr:transcriptional regulator MraZ [Micrococcales bacterium]NBR60331.1 transcriptional regulator MraZ [Actinomycetota bacterium]NBR54394.1 transcriptional regulator MraZ [Micrococcales bacterium]NBT46229.1 transcriptional regulator MraZ [Actinomycetota bacterium]NBY43501.1 transcriptional regulator MraZ [Micrococcales bacterium]